MRVIYDGRLHVTYWQAYVEPLDPAPEEVVRRRSEKAVSQNGSDNRPTHSHEGLTLWGTLTDR